MFVRLIYQARRLEARRLQLTKEKQDAFALSQKEDVKLTRKQKYRHYCYDLQRKIKRILCPKFPKHSCPYRLCFNIKNNGTCENFVAKSIAGFLGGFVLTYIFFMFFVLQLNFTLSTATIMCAIFGSILTIGLAFSFKVRCIVFLVLPQFFSKKGRQALLAYAYILAITGPAKNTLNNMSILGESLACGQEQLKAAVKQILEVIKKPFYAIRDAIKKVVATVKEIVLKIKEILLGIKRVIMSLVDIIKAAFNFIGRIMNICNSEFGTPFQRCSNVFEDAVVDCNAKLGPMFNWLCNITYLVKSVCYIAKGLDFLCHIVNFIKGTVSAIVTKVKQFVRHIRTMFYVRIKFSHSYHFESNHTKSMGDITTGIVTEIKQRSSGLIKIFDFMSSAASFFFIFMVVKVIYYRHKFLTNEMFDNKFITKDFRLLDLRRAQLGLETVLPLNHRERKLYISTSSMRLVKKEKSRLSKAAMILLMSTLKLSTHMATDYSLYWIMTKIRYYGRFQSKIDAPNIPGVSIEGEGFLASLLKGIVRAFQPLGINLEIDTIPCLPDPIPPDYDRYIQIASMLVLCWFLAIFEPYGLRFRHSVMCFYHPQRARERSIWLYNHILRSRSSFLKFARRQLRRKVMSDKSVNKITCKEFLQSRIAKYPICVLFFGSGKQQYCLLCGEVYREEDNKKFIKCQTPKCPGLYCEQCFNDLQNLCTVCLDPINYGDLSDISEEKDSSEDEDKKRRKLSAEKKQKKKSKSKKKKKNKYSDYNDDDEDDDYDDKKKLLPHKKDTDDSDYDTGPGLQGFESDWSSDYDMEYQYHKDISRVSENTTPRNHHQDVEKQNIPNLASIQDFHAELVFNLNIASGTGLRDIEELDTSSMITDLNDVSMRHLNQSSSNQQQSWLKCMSYRNFGLQTGRSILDSSDISTPESSLYEHFSSDSEYDTVFQSGDIQMKRLNSKISFFNALDLEELERSSGKRSSLSSSGLWGEITPTTPSSIAESPNLEEECKFRVMSKEEKNLLNVATSMERISLTSYDTPASSLCSCRSDINISPLQLGSNIEDSSLEVSPLTMNCSPRSAITSLDRNQTKEVHPDVPKLNLTFLDSNKPKKAQTLKTIENCNCNMISPSKASESLTGSWTSTRTPSSSFSTTSPSSRRCNCHYFKDKVKLSVINEYDTSCSRNTTVSSFEDILEENVDEYIETATSSLISSCKRALLGKDQLNNQKSIHFNECLAGNDTLISTALTYPNTSDRSVRKCSLDATTTTYFDMQTNTKHHVRWYDDKGVVKEDESETSYDLVDNESSENETVFVVPTKHRSQIEVDPLLVSKDSEEEQRRMYKDRIRCYYKHLKIQSQSDLYDSVGDSGDSQDGKQTEVKKTFNPLKALFGLFSSNKSKYKYRRCKNEDNS